MPTFTLNGLGLRGGAVKQLRTYKIRAATPLVSLVTSAAENDTIMLLPDPAHHLHAHLVPFARRLRLEPAGTDVHIQTRRAGTFKSGSTLDPDPLVHLLISQWSTDTGATVLLGTYFEEERLLVILNSYGEGVVFQQTPRGRLTEYPITPALRDALSERIALCADIQRLTTET